MVGILTKAYEDRISFVRSHFITDLGSGSELFDLVKGANDEQKKKVKKVMDEWKSGKLKSGSKEGKRVTDQKQAIAIAMSEAGLSKGMKKCMHTNIIEGVCKDCGKEVIEKDMEGGSVEMSVEKALHNLFGNELEEITDPIDKAFVDILEKGGAGSNKAGRIIGSTRSGKPIHSLKGAHEYKDFEAVDHEEAYKHHMHHAQKVQGVAAVNSRIRAHDHADQAQIKAAKAEQEKVAAKTAKGSKEIQAKEKAKQMKTGVKPAAKKKPVKKSEEDELEKGEIFNTFTSTYGDKEPLRFSKSGKDIINKLRKLNNKLDGEIMDLEGHMGNEEDIIGFEPDDVNNSYSIKGKGIQTKRYSYDFCYGACVSEPKVEIAVAIPVKKEVNIKQVSVQQACQRYNNFSSQLLSALEDIETIRLMINNLEPGKKYNLNVTQLASLGF